MDGLVVVTHTDGCASLQCLVAESEVPSLLEDPHVPYDWKVIIEPYEPENN